MGGVIGHVYVSCTTGTYYVRMQPYSSYVLCTCVQCLSTERTSKRRSFRVKSSAVFLRQSSSLPFLLLPARLLVKNRLWARTFSPLHSWEEKRCPASMLPFFASCPSYLLFSLFLSVPLWWFPFWWFFLARFFLLCKKVINWYCVRSLRSIDVGVCRRCLF